MPATAPVSLPGRAGRPENQDDPHIRNKPGIRTPQPGNLFEIRRVEATNRGGSQIVLDRRIGCVPAGNGPAGLRRSRPYLNFRMREDIMSTSQRKIEANQLNAQKSTGPRTEEGKANSRCNAFKHGMRGSLPVQPGEDAKVFYNHVEQCREELKPQTYLQRIAVDDFAIALWEADRARRASNVRLELRFDTRDERLADEVAVLGNRLFRDPAGPTQKYGIGRYDFCNERTSCPDPDDVMSDPSCLIRRLEATEMGCRWLLDRWKELRVRLEPGKYWEGQDKFKATRLLGKQPLDVADVEDVAGIYLASFAIKPKRKKPFAELRSELGIVEYPAFQKRVPDFYTSRPEFNDPVKAREFLIALTECAIERLTAKLRPKGDKEILDEAERRASLLWFDDSREAERLRSYEMACDRKLSRALDRLHKLRKEEGGEGGGGSRQDDPLASFDYERARNREREDDPSQHDTSWAAAACREVYPEAAELPVVAPDAPSEDDLDEIVAELEWQRAEGSAAESAAENCANEPTVESCESVQETAAVEVKGDFGGAAADDGNAFLRAERGVEGVEPMVEGDFGGLPPEQMAPGAT